MTLAAMDLEDIQGNVLQGYALPYCAYVNLHVVDPAEGRALLGHLVDHVTRADCSDLHHRRTTLNVAVSHEGLRRLGVAPAALDAFPEEFRAGMAARAEQLGDVGASTPARWQGGLCPGELHVLAIVHARSEHDRKGEVQRLRDLAGAYRGVRVGEPECGAVGTGRHRMREHFGFADGFGQPAVAGQTGPEYRGQGVPVAGRRRLRRRRQEPWRLVATGEFIHGHDDEDGVAPAPPEPFDRNGTFMVFRKLEQDVIGFRRLLRELADEHFNEDVELAAAKLAGRWRDGTPLLLSPERPDPLLAADKWRTNDFRYARDRDGRGCPIAAHIRRANPRDSLFGGGDRTRRHRIIRRGMPYGDPLPEEAEEGGGRGLLFVCFNASIARQFEVVNGWLTRGGAFGLADGDVLTDRTGAPRITIDGDPPIVFRPATVCDPLVTTRGGEYLFLPSLGALAGLARGDAGA